MAAITLIPTASLLEFRSSKPQLCNPVFNFNPLQFCTPMASPSTTAGHRFKLGNSKVTQAAFSSSFSSDNKKTDPMLPPYNVLITGGSKGIGYALAKEFLKAGDNVLICSRSADRVDSALESLRNETGKQHVWGTKCDVRDSEDVKSLVAFAKQNLKYIDIWINNAGSNAYSYKPLVEASDEDLIEVVTTNTLGLMICCREAINMMLSQPRGGHVFNIDGAGSDGRPTPKFAAYGATKRSVVHLTKSLQAELEMQDVKTVVVHNLSPGMVTTDLLMSGANTKQAKFFINILAEPPDVVAEYLVPNIRSIPTSGSTKPTYIRFLTGLKAYSQIFSRIAFGARRNRYVLED
ncbi:PREDICTED: chlorophyll(ide) b reductase NOL, chloroplastic [Ipomoea nil]|uniref:chlorophyll(ide) b reductase NOL, chloroplastic n=1 Tax=Ipomoea nil TaxID=35883 RepID=UPI000900CB89|nr:PREDICTED: chlorophyll(ide) b reductase NOL, chloroplastic [Ipomoea nil]